MPRAARLGCRGCSRPLAPARRQVVAAASAQALAHFRAVAVASQVRAGTTVVSANVAYPADSGPLARAVGKLVRTARRVQAAGGAAARRMREITGKLRSRGKLSREESTMMIRRVTGELAGLAAAAAAQAAAVLRNGRRAVPKALSGRVRGRLRRALCELATTMERTEKI